MIVTVHRTSVVLSPPGDHLGAKWDEFQFQPSAWEVSLTPSGWEAIRSTSVPVRVVAPVGSRLESARLVTYSAPGGLDAASVHHLAVRGLDGFALAVDDPVEGAGTADRGPLLDAVAALAERQRRLAGWGIAFASKALPYHRSWLEDLEYPRCPITSTNDVERAKRWPEASEAFAWLADAGLSADKPVPVGIGYLYPVVVTVNLSIDLGCEPGVAFILPPRTLRPPLTPPPAPEPATPKSKRGPRMVRGQQSLLFMGED